MQQSTERVFQQAVELQNQGQHSQVIELLTPYQTEDDERDIRLTVQLAEAKRRLQETPEAVRLYEGATLFYAGEGMLAHAVALDQIIAGLAPKKASTLPQIAAAYAQAPAGMDGGAPFADLFFHMDPGALDVLFSTGQIHRLTRGDTIINGDDEGRGLFVVLKGEVRLFGRGSDGKWAEASRLRGGQLFNQRGLVWGTNIGRAVAAFNSVVLEVPAATLNGIAARDETFSGGLKRLERRLSLEQGLVSNAAFGSLNHHARSRLSDVMDEVVLNRGSIIFREGDASEHLFMVQEGRVEVYTEGAEGRLELAQLPAGELFGEAAVLGRPPRSASLRARTDVVLYRIGADRLDEILIDQPTALTHMKDIFRQRVSDTLNRLDDDGH